MAEIAFENGRICNFKGLVTLTCRTSLIDLHPDAKLKSKKLFVDAWTYVDTDGHLRPALLGQLCRRVDLKMSCYQQTQQRNTTSLKII